MPSRSSRPLWLALTLSLAAAIQSPALASEEDPAALQAARDKFQNALALQTGGDWAGALALLKEVAAVRSTPHVRFNIALCEENLGQLVAAVGDYELAASDARQEDAPEVFEQAEARLEALRGKIPKIVIQRGLNAETATITLDGVALGDRVIGRSMNVDPGPHVITGRAAGFESFRTTIRLDEMQVETVEVKLEPLPPPPPRPDLPPVVPDKTSNNQRVAAYVIGGVGVAALVGGSVLLGLGQRDQNTLESRCNAGSCDPSLKPTYDRGKRYTLLGNIGVGAGTAAVGTGLVLLLTSEPDDASGFAPFAEQADLGVSYRGRF